MSIETGLVGVELREERVRAGLTQRELADRAGVSVRTIRYLERGEISRPHKESLRRLADAIGLAPRTAATQELSIAVLGPLTAWRGENQLDLGPAKQRSLLALLALHPDQVVQQDEIVETLWGERPPTTWRDLVHSYASRLRRVLDLEAAQTSVLTAVRGGYRLTLTAAESDVRRFRDLVATAQAHPEQAFSLWSQAIACWRDVVAADVGDRVRAHATAIALGRQRIAAVLAFADAAFELGRPAAAVAPLQTLAALEPLHEGLHARLMLALAGSGQQAEALRLHVGVTERLDQELGVTTGPELQAAFERVLRREWPGNQVAVSRRPAQLPATAAAFTGRTDAMNLLDKIASATGEAVVAILSGTAGVGKTALALHWARHAVDRFPDGQLYLDLRGFAAGPAVTTAQALELLLRGLGISGDALPPDVDGRTALYRTELAGRRMLIVLDNAADAEQVRPLLPGQPGCVVLITSRVALAGLVALDGARRIDLAVLDHDEALDLVRRLVGPHRFEAEPAAAARLTELCARLPLALRIAAANLGAQPLAGYVRELAEDRISGLAVDGDPRAVVHTQFGHSYEKLSAGQRALFRLLGLVPGPDVTPGAAAALAASTVDSAVTRLRRLAAAHLLEQRDSGRYGFHDLLKAYALRTTSEEDSEDDRSAALHRLFGWYLATATAAVNRIAPHRRQLPEPPRVTREFADYEEAMAWLETERANLLAAITESERRGWDTTVWKLTHTLARYFHIRTYLPDWLNTHETALGAARRLGDRWAEAEMLTSLAIANQYYGQHRQAIECFHRALELRGELGDRLGEGNTRNSLGIACYKSGDHDLALGHYERSLRLYREVGDPRGQAAATNNLAVVLKRLGRYADALRYQRDALELSRRLQEPHVEASCWDNLGVIHQRLGQASEAIECHERAIVWQRQYGDEQGEVMATANLANAHRLLGRPAEALDRLGRVVDTARRLGHRDTQSHVHNSMGEAHHDAGDLERALEEHREALAIAEASSNPYEQARAHQGIARALRDPAGSHWRRAVELYDQLGAVEADEMRAEVAR